MDEKKDGIGTESFIGDVEPILPDGWKEGLTLDELVKEDSGDGGAADGQDPEAVVLEPEEDQLSELAGRTKTEGDEPEPDAGTEAEGTPADGQEKPSAAAPRSLRLKVNHQEKDVDVNAMSDDDLRALLQKGYAFDEMKDAENRRTFRSVYQEQVDAGMTEAAARMIAREAAGGKSYSLEDEEEAPAPVTEPGARADASVPRDLAAEIAQLRLMYPDFKEVPDEVARAVSQGVPVITAYLAYRDRERNKAVAQLEKENKVLKQNAAAAAKAPVRGVSGSGTVKTKDPDIFEKGFDEGMKWNSL